jgi:type IV pilus assembly protein PilO
MAKGLRDLPENWQIAFLAFIPMLLAAVAYVYWARPIQKQRDRLATELKALHAQNQSNRMFDSQLKKNLARITSLKSQLEVLRSIVPEEEDTGGFVKLIQDASVATGIHVRSLVAQPLVQHEQYAEQPFKVRLDGTYYPLLDFFDRLGHAQRIVNVMILSLGEPQAKGGLGNYTVPPSATVAAECIFRTYFSSAQAAAPGARK